MVLNDFQPELAENAFVQLLGHCSGENALCFLATKKGSLSRRESVNHTRQLGVVGSVIGSDAVHVAGM